MSYLRSTDCFLFVILALLRWRRPIEPSHRAPVENFFESFASAIRYVRLTPAIRVVVLRGALFGLFIAVIPALVPVVGLKKLYLGVSHFGLLLTSMAIGSVLGAVFVVPRVRASFTPNAVTILACAMLGLVYFLIGCINQSWGNARVGTKFAVSITLKVLPRLDIIFQEIMRFFREKMRPDTFPTRFFLAVLG
jgi:hypothetical protein